MITVKADNESIKQFEGVYHNCNEVYPLIEEAGYFWAAWINDTIEVDHIRYENDEIVETHMGTLHYEGTEVFDF